MKSRLYTIGYAAFPTVSDFISQLKKYCADAVIDVRSVPSSPVFPQFDASSLPDKLISEGISYISFADEFGERQADSSLYRDGRLDFDAFSRTDTFRRGIARLEIGLDKGLTPVLMGEDADPASGHRGILVSRALSSLGYEVMHIVPGGLKPHGQLEEELVAAAAEKIRSQRAQMSLLPSDDPAMPGRDALLEEGYRMKNREIAFFREDLI